MDPLVFLVLQLALPGHDPIAGRLPMPTLEVCAVTAERFLKSFADQAEDGGEAAAGCVVRIEPKQPS